MELKFLANGQACYVNDKIGDKFIINKVFEYEDPEYGTQEVIDNNDVVVDLVFDRPPIEKISEEIKELKIQRKKSDKELKELDEKLREIKREIAQMSRTKIDNEKFIINRSELIKAKTLALFPKNRVMPKTMNNSDKSFRGLKVSLSIEISSGGERSWGFSLYWDYAGGDDYLCEKYGILIDPTEEEIDETIRKRLREFVFPDYEISKVPDRYLSEDQKQIKIKYKDSEKAKQTEMLKQRIIQAEQSLAKLQDELNS